MLQIPESVRQELAKLISASVVNDVVCFVFYDNHPRGNSALDVTVCTKNCELKEYFQRDAIFSLDLETEFVPTEINIIRNLKCELFYLVLTKTELVIISSENKCVVKKITGVDKYYFDDYSCSGNSLLKVVKTHDAVPVIYDDNFNIVEDGVDCNKNCSEESTPIIIELKRKLTEAQYSYNCNLKTLKEYRTLRQQATLSTCSKLHPNQKDSTFKTTQSAVGSLKIKQTPLIKVCNQKLIIAVPVINDYTESIKDIKILLTSQPVPTSLIYETKVFEKRTSSPFWREHDQRVLTQREFALVCVMDNEEVKYRTTSRIDLSIAISYRVLEKDFILPMDDIKISSLESIGEEFDALFGDQIVHDTILFIMASTNKTELNFTLIKQQEQRPTSMMELLCTYLHMDKVNDNVIIYKKSPYHILNGLMLVFDDNVQSDIDVTASVYARSPSQVIALIHLIHDAVPHQIIPTTPNITFELKQDQTKNKNLNVTEYAASLLKRSGTILEYLDNSMIRMSESKNTLILNKIGNQIDLFAGGASNFVELKSKLELEARAGIKSLDDDCMENAMVVD